MAVIHDRILAELKADIAEGRLKQGDRLPGLKQLQERFGASYGPVRESVLILKYEGLIVGHQGKGMFVL